MTCFRRKDIPSILTATIPFYITVQCSGLAPDSLVQQNKNACLRLQPDDTPLQSPVAHLPQKPELYEIVIITLSVYRNINSTCLSITRKEGCYESLRECYASVMIVSVLIYFYPLCVLTCFIFHVHLCQQILCRADFTGKGSGIIIHLYTGASGKLHLCSAIGVDNLFCMMQHNLAGCGIVFAILLPAFHRHQAEFFFQHKWYTAGVSAQHSSALAGQNTGAAAQMKQQIIQHPAQPLGNIIFCAIQIADFCAVSTVRQIHRQDGTDFPPVCFILWQLYLNFRKQASFLSLVLLCDFPPVPCSFIGDGLLHIRYSVFVVIAVDTADILPAHIAAK